MSAMLSLLLIAGVHGALQTDFANVYYCPEGYCLDKKEREPGFAGPQAMFVECTMEGEESESPLLYNHYTTEGNQLDRENMWSFDENIKTLPKMLKDGGSTGYLSKCCDGYDGAKQCEVMNNMSTEKKEEQGCCYNMGFGAMMKPCCHAKHENMKEEDMIGFSMCPVEDKRMGGETRFETGATCSGLEAKKWQGESRVCCEAVTPDCEACKLGVSKPSYCKKFPKMEGCEKKVCCKAMTANCLSCSKGVSVADYCKENPRTEGCPRACCKAQTASCLACGKGMTVEQLCKKMPKTPGCGDDVVVQTDVCSAGDASKKACKKNMKSLKKDKKMDRSDKCSYIKKQKKCMMVTNENCMKMKGKKNCKKFKGCVFDDNNNKCGL